MTEENEWSWSCTDLPADRWGAASVVHEGQIWVMGGCVGNLNTASVIIYDAEADTWSEGPPLPGICVSGRAAVTEGVIFLTNGVKSFQYNTAAWSEVFFPNEAIAGGMHNAALGSVLLG